MREFTGKMIGMPEDMTIWWVEMLMTQYREKQRKQTSGVGTV